ncbi:vWA domain-containing protein [Haliea sp. E1-2-M8]|uniref:vWA domain-containing protein n=1 Tax=Haliea sp. E1-2-M8 TaxID=3064706 RepID=UPI00271A42D5|nr:vWA domain-containing protein [Haliea sp. E1-2-M8]MDO8862421.1 vWA domain-containing protein [Haliea sp. E1-2-M8]
MLKMSTRLPVLFAVGLLLLAVLLPAARLHAQAPLGPQPDLRLLIDISGSMKESDPDNLRGPALELIVRLLPEGARAGVWIFGEEVEQIVPHATVNTAWREQALEAVARIDNSGQRTNIPAALAAATYDLGSLSSDYRTSIVLLTDGKVDVSPSPMANAAAARELLAETAPDLGATGIPVHTIALSDEADWTFLRALADSTAGIAEKAQNAGELTGIFVQSLEMVAPSARVPVVGNIFLIDESVEEFTALVFFDEPAADVTLTSPGGSEYHPDEARDGVEWFRSGQFALVTVDSPERGAWTLAVPDGASSRVSVISDLQLEVDPLPNSLPAGRVTELGIRLRDSGEVINSEEVMQLFEISVLITGPEDFSETIDVTGSYPLPATGEYRVTIPAFEESGRYQLLVELKGETLDRELPLYVEVIAPSAAPTISTRPPEIPEEDLKGPALSLAAILLLAIIIGAVVYWRRRQRKLAIWQRRFEQNRDTPADPAVSGMHADADADHDKAP